MTAGSSNTETTFILAIEGKQVELFPVLERAFDFLRDDPARWKGDLSRVRIEHVQGGECHAVDLNEYRDRFADLSA